MPKEGDGIYDYLCCGKELSLQAKRDSVLMKIEEKKKEYENLKEQLQKKEAEQKNEVKMRMNKKIQKELKEKRMKGLDENIPVYEVEDGHEGNLNEIVLGILSSHFAEHFRNYGYDVSPMTNPAASSRPHIMYYADKKKDIDERIKRNELAKQNLLDEYNSASKRLKVFTERLDNLMFQGHLKCKTESGLTTVNLITFDGKYDICKNVYSYPCNISNPPSNVDCITLVTLANKNVGDYSMFVAVNRSLSCEQLYKIVTYHFIYVNVMTEKDSIVISNYDQDIPRGNELAYRYLNEERDGYYSVQVTVNNEGQWPPPNMPCEINSLTYSKYKKMQYGRAVRVFCNSLPPGKDLEVLSHLCKVAKRDGIQKVEILCNHD